MVRPSSSRLVLCADIITGSFETNTSFPLLIIANTFGMSKLSCDNVRC